MATLPAADVALFIRLHVAVYVNRKLGLVPDVDSEEAFRKSSREDKVKIRDSMYASQQLIDSFVAENPAGFPPAELALVAAWKQ